MKLEAFETLAGSIYGGYTMRMVAAELIARMPNSGANDMQFELLTALAETSDDEPETLASIVDEAIDYLQCTEVLPPFCSIQWEDNEVRVIPYVDDELPRVSDPAELDERTEDYVLSVTDHGNVTLWERVGEPVPRTDGYSEYREVWSMV